MQARLLAHIKGQTNSFEFHKDIRKVALIFEKDADKRILAEKYLINKLDTLRNVQYVEGKRYKKIGFGKVNPFGNCPYLRGGKHLCGKRAHANGFCYSHGGNGVTVASLQEKAVEDYLKTAAIEQEE